MKHLCLFGLTILMASCGPKIAEPPKNCAIPSSGFWSYNDKGFWAGKGIPVVPAEIMTIMVLKDKETEIFGLHHRSVAKWNGTPIDMLTLETYLQALANLPPGMGSYTNLDFPRGAPCNRVNAIRQAMEKDLKCTRDRVCLQGYQPPAE
jgi:hypothetical protein